jgi:hypothetical protein
MRKFIIISLAIIAILVAWKYVGSYIKKRALQTAPVSAIDNTLNAAGDYIPNQIQLKNDMENRVNDSVQKENNHLKGSLGN